MRSARLRKLLFAPLVVVMLSTACGGDDGTVSPGDRDDDEDGGNLASGDLPDLEGQRITIAVDNAHLPFNYVDPDTGERAGLDYDAWEAICDLINCVPVYEAAARSGMVRAVADGRFDAAADGLAITEERAEVVDFSDGYITTEQRLLVRSDEDRFVRAAEVVADTSIRIGTQTGTTNYDTAVDFFGESRVQEFARFPLAIDALLDGDIDVVIIDDTAGQGYRGVAAHEVALIGDPLERGELGFIFAKGSDLVDPVNAALAALAADGTLDELVDAYFGPGFTLTDDDLES